MVDKSTVEGAELLAERLLKTFKEPEGLEFHDRVKSVMYHHFCDIIMNELKIIKLDWEMEVDQEAKERGE